MDALVAALSPDALDARSEDEAPPPPPPPPPSPPPSTADKLSLDEEFFLPDGEDEEALDDTVVLPAEELSRPMHERSPTTQKPPETHLHHGAPRKSPALDGSRTFLLVAAVVVVLIAALIAAAFIMRQAP